MIERLAKGLWVPVLMALWELVGRRGDKKHTEHRDSETLEQSQPRDAPDPDAPDDGGDDDSDPR